jgi:cytidylate kinase
MEPTVSPSDLRTLVIAIDGPSGSGKSTVARGVARTLRLRYLDTGAMYRALTWLALHEQVDPADAAGVARLATTAHLEISSDPDDAWVRINGTDVTTQIRGTDVTDTVSQVSAVPAVRTEMVRRQREAIGSGGIVVEGRDIGTTVAPEAPVKVFLTAAPDARAHRRAAESGAVDGPGVAATGASLRRRDHLDSARAASPLAQAPDALVVDSTHLSADEVIAKVLDAAQAVRA